MGVQDPETLVHEALGDADLLPHDVLAREIEKQGAKEREVVLALRTTTETSGRTDPATSDVAHVHVHVLRQSQTPLPSLLTTGDTKRRKTNTRRNGAEAVIKSERSARRRRKRKRLVCLNSATPLLAQTYPVSPSPEKEGCQCSNTPMGQVWSHNRNRVCPSSTS